MQAELLTSLAVEWQVLSDQAQAIATRKREMRESLEVHFSAIMPELNRELRDMGLKYCFDERQHAGYTAEGPLVLRLYPNYKGRWQNGAWLVDYGRAEELTKIVLETRVIRKFLEVFPYARITVEHNYGGNDKPLPSIKRRLGATQKRRVDISA